MPLSKFLKLESGQLMPALGLGTWQSKPNEVKHAVLHALKCGYTHIDCAHVYQNETEIGEALKQFRDSSNNKVDRKSLFITSKLWNYDHRPENVRPACLKTLKDLGLEYLDLYLIHWPLAFKKIKSGEHGYVLFPKNKEGVAELDKEVKIEDTWKAMEKLVEDGLVKNIGVSNFNIPLLQRILKVAKIKPAVNQVELHPYLPQNELVDFCQSNHIAPTAYSPLGSGREPSLMDDPTVVKIAQKHSVTPANILISWAVNRNTVVIPKSVNTGRIESNMKLVELSDEEMKELGQLGNKNHRFIDISGLCGVDIWNMK